MIPSRNLLVPARTGVSAVLLLALAPMGVAQSAPAPISEETPEGLEAGDWTSIRAAYEAGLHKAFAVEGDFQARNPGQQWLTQFDGKGFLVSPDGGAWSWGLQLESFGFEHKMQAPPERALAVNATGNRVVYDWNENVQEWYVNDARGLEHGYTLKERPPGAARTNGPLVFELAVRGSLSPEVLADGSGVRFLNKEGGTTLTYAGLHVFDVDGTVQAASFSLDSGHLRLSIQESDARYPLTIDPVAQQAYLKASNTGANDQFGFSVAISGDLVVVGAPNEDSAATGVNGNQADNSAGESGAAYIFERVAGTWSQSAYLKASNTDADDLFGYSVAISGDFVVIGAWGEASASTGVDGNQSDNSTSWSGATYIFERVAGTWGQTAYLKASNTDAGDWFGVSVAISGDLVVVGAAAEASAATGVDGNQADNSTGHSGAAYIFERVAGTWSQRAYLKASNTGWADNFGVSVAISGDLVVVGARAEASAATGVDGNQSDNSATWAGAAYIFERVAGTWGQRAYLKASNTDPGDFFGNTVGVSGDLVVVAARGEASASTGVDGNQTDNSGVESGAAYIFERVAGTWSQSAYLKASNTSVSDVFGRSVAISGSRVVVGANIEDSAATGVGGNQADNNASQSGAAYIFERVAGAWGQIAYLKASNTQVGQRFGCSVAISGDLVVVGAQNERSAATGVDGNQADNGAPESGAAYIFEMDGGPSFAFCFGDGTGSACPCGNSGGTGEGCANQTGSGAILMAMGHAALSSDTLRFSVAGIDGAKPGLLLRADNQLSGGNGVMVGDGLLCVGGNSQRSQIVMSDASGTATLSDFNGNPFGVTANPPGTATQFQWWYRDPAGAPCGAEFNFSNALSVTYTP